MNPRLRSGGVISLVVAAAMMGLPPLGPAPYHGSIVPTDEDRERKAKAETATIEAAREKRRRKLDRFTGTAAAKARRAEMEREFDTGIPISEPTMLDPDPQ